MANVLVVDDSGTVRSEVSGFLSQHGLNVATAVDGCDGLAKIQADRDLKLVICDINMPNMDGLTMVEKVKQSGRNIHIIMLTTESNAEMKNRGRNAGVKGWIVKPFNGAAAIAGIKNLAS
ncbi:response regulator receiver protein [Alteromonadaceae bacterium 2753L.S.0a.02]|nr:response regulator receiver protein [Alteromonadaceae bacterium 2753L.S.0a.02]